MPTQKLATSVYFELNDGHRIPALGMGTVPPDDPSLVKQQIIEAVKAGYRHIDTAWYYTTEKYVGEALKELFAEGVVKREDLFITTKVWHSFWHNPEKSLDQSLEALGLDYVDLFLQHWPICTHGDENGRPVRPMTFWNMPDYDDDPVTGTKFIEVYNKIEDIKINTSKVRSVGVSNYSIPKLKALLPKVKKYVPVVNQVEAHPHLPIQDLFDFCAEHKIIIEAFSPVGSTGAPVAKDPFIIKMGEKHGVTSNEIINAYHILQGRVVIPRSTNPERIRTNVRLPQLSKEELHELYELGEKNPRRYICDPWGYGLSHKYWKGDTLSK